MSAIPRYDPQPTGKMTAIPSVSFVGEEAAEESMLKIAASGYRLAQAGEEMRANAEQQYMDGLEVDVITNFSRIEADHKGDPEGLKKNLGGYIDSVVSNIPFAFDKSRMKNALSKQAARAYASAVTSAASAGQASARAEAKARNELIQTQIQDFGMPKNDADKEALADLVATYKAGLDNQVRAGVMAPSEVTLHLYKLQQEQTMSMAVDFIQHSDNPSREMYAIFDGRSTVPEFNKMAPEDRQKLLAKVQQLTTLQQSILSVPKNEALLTNQLERKSFLTSLLSDPATIKTSQGEQMYDALVNKLATTEDVEEAQHVRHFFENLADPRYQKSEAKVFDEARSAVEQHNISDTQLLRLHGEGLSTQDFLQLKEMKAQSEQLLNKADYDSFFQQVSSTVQGKINPSFWQQVKSLSFGGVKYDANQVDLATKSLFKDFHEGLISGAIPHTNQGVQDFWEKRKPGFLQSIGTADKEQTPDMRAEVIKQQDPDLQSIADKYTSGQQLIQDMKAGIITKEQAQKINILKGFSKQLMEKQNGR